MHRAMATMAVLQPTLSAAAPQKMRPRRFAAEAAEPTAARYLSEEK
eukprot:CAMPEP_0118971654 /NCGR_PEP_ID=MMETSP1173-20130426/8213_1 /TAXON_ID=1034831 /ORGANISM="Rhizochromulina marina cf, Strain CCMP1243" /LENGTH=45 /DNA_ID= /DNA_START= /DNA_END= /DNA_ORIENTATION=